ncbi:MAG: peptide chain release factor N(5)-glutamine methyltransferase [Patescibacteria group bacterium]
MTIQEALKIFTKKLQAKKNKTAALDAEVLLSFVIKKPKEFLYSHSEAKLTKLQLKKLSKLAARRTKGEPIAYLVKQKEFFGLSFLVDKRVLIPRPETELLVEEVIKEIRDQRSGIRDERLSVADIGTGSGCIIISLAKSYKIKAISYLATDNSKLALQVAKLNAKTHQVKIKFLHGNLLKPLKNVKIDILIANLPYGWPQWKNNSSMQTAALKFEPKNALFAKENGLYLYHQLFEQIAKRKQKPKFIFIEFDPRQKTKLQKLLKKYLPNYQVEIKKDLAGLNRILVIKLGPNV